MASNLLKCSSCNIVINEVLAFINNKIDVMDEESLSRICVSAFSDEDILSAKNLLYESIPTEKRKKTRKRDGKKVREIDDIISLLKVTDPEVVPVFVARELHKLPPVLFDHVDVTRLLKDLTQLQQQTKLIREEYVTKKEMDSLKLELKNLKKASLVNNFESTICNVNKRRGAFLLNSSEEYCSGPKGLTYMDPNITATSQNHCDLHIGNDYPNVSNFFSQSEGTTKTLDIVASASNEVGTIPTPAPAPPLPQDAHPQRATTDDALPVGAVAVSGTGHTAAQNVHSNVYSKGKLLADVVRTGDWKVPKQDEEWTLVQKRRLRNRFVANRGKAIVGPDVNFKAADIKIPIYIYNVAKDVPMCDIASYICSKTNLTVDLEKMSMKVPKAYDAYKVLVPKHKLEIFLKNDFWPEGIAYRRFVDFKTKNNYGKNSEQSTRV